MHEAGLQRPGTMAAILGELRETIDHVCERAASAGVVVPANYNSAEQVVISGELGAVDRAMELAREAGAKRTLPLNVSGAFHSPLMTPSSDGLAQAIGEAALRDPRFPVYSNVTEIACDKATDAAGLLLRQLTSPVRWQGLVKNLAAAWPHAVFVEMGPGAVLAGLVKRIAPGIRTMPCGTVAQIESVLSMVA
jgi:[acyl-carrier-protein] S-malonyltransferase